MTATLDDVTKKSKREPTAEEKVAEELVRRAREQGLSLTGPDGATQPDGLTERSPIWSRPTRTDILFCMLCT
jgi:hypothetical protein